MYELVMIEKEGPDSMRTDNGGDTQLDDFAAPIVATLQTVVTQLTQLDTIVTTGQNNLSKQAGMLAGDGPQAYQGLAAETFKQAVTNSTNVGKDRLKAIQEATDACKTCLNAIQSALAAADPNVYPDVLGMILPHVTLGDVIQQGAGPIDGTFASIKPGYIGDRENYYEANEPLDGSTPQQAAERDWESEFVPVQKALDQWAASVQTAVARWRAEMATATNDADHWEPDLVPQTEQQLAEMIFAQYHTGKPIGITQIGNGTLLVTLAGVEQNPNQANTLLNAVDAGGGDMNNPYEQDVYNAIEAYLQAHPDLPRPVHIVIAGHSYGGMVGEELASKYHGGQGGFTVDDVVTFGSPNVVAHSSGVTYRQYFDQYDAVPLLSRYQLQNLAPILTGLPAILGPAGLVIDGALVDGIINDPRLKSWYTGETYVPDVGHNPDPYAWINDDHGAYVNSVWLSQQPIPFNISDMQATSYYPAPPAGH